MLRRLRAPVPPEPPPAHATAFPASPLARAPSLRHPRIPTPRHLRPSLRKAVDRRVLHPAPPGPGLHGSAAGPSSLSAALGASFLAGFDGNLPSAPRGSASFALSLWSIPWSTHSPFAGFPSWAPSEGGFPSKPARNHPFRWLGSGWSDRPTDRAGWAAAGRIDRPPGLAGRFDHLDWPGPPPFVGPAAARSGPVRRRGGARKRDGRGRPIRPHVPSDTHPSESVRAHPSRTRPALNRPRSPSLPRRPTPL